MNEIERLELEYGWIAPKLDEFDVRRFENVKYPEELISFPNDAYAGENLSRDDFWSRFRVKLIANSLYKNNIKCLWEVGGGDGRVAISLGKLGYEVVAVEPIQSGARKLAKNGLKTFNSRLEDLSLPNESLQAIGIFDVLEHIRDEKMFLEEIRRVLKLGGKLFLTVPAHSWLFSGHDEALGHYRRYNRKSLIKTLSSAGMKVVEIRYVFATLIIPALALRRIPYKLGFKRKANINLQESEGSLRLPKWFDSILFKVVQLEYKFKFRFGLSLFVVCKKQ